MEKVALNIDEVVEMQKRFTELYQTTNIIAVSTKGVQLYTIEALQELPGEMHIKELSGDMDYPYEHYKIIDGVTFFTVEECIASS